MTRCRSYGSRRAAGTPCTAGGASSRANDGDGLAHLTLERAGSYRINGFARLHATRFRLRRRMTVVESHVWLEPDFIVRVAGARGGRARVVGSIPFSAPREVSSEIPCDDLAYDGKKEQVAEPRS